RHRARQDPEGHARARDRRSEVRSAGLIAWTLVYLVRAAGVGRRRSGGVGRGDRRVDDDRRFGDDDDARVGPGADRRVGSALARVEAGPVLAGRADEAGLAVVAHLAAIADALLARPEDEHRAKKQTKLGHVEEASIAEKSADVAYAPETDVDRSGVGRLPAP